MMRTRGGYQTCVVNNNYVQAFARYFVQANLEGWFEVEPLLGSEIWPYLMDGFCTNRLHLRHNKERGCPYVGWPLCSSRERLEPPDLFLIQKFP